MGTAYASVSAYITRVGTGVVVNLGTAVETGSAHIQTKALDFGHDNLIKYIERILCNIRGRQANANATLKIYGSDDEEGPFELLDTIQLVDNDPVYTDPPGMRFYKIRFADDGIMSRWAVHGFTIYGVVGGEEF
jgi:hypothetical protein